MRTYADDFLLVSEEEIKDAIVFAWEQYGEIIEGAGATALAASLTRKVSVPVVLIISGGNIQPEIHKQIINAARK